MQRTIDKMHANGITALFCAIKKYDDRAVHELLSAGANPNIPSETGELPIAYSLVGCQFKMVAYLLLYGAEIDESAKTRLMEIKKIVMDEIVKLLASEEFNTRKGVEIGLRFLQKIGVNKVPDRQSDPLLQSIFFQQRKCWGLFCTIEHPAAVLLNELLATLQSRQNELGMREEKFAVQSFRCKKMS